MDDTPDIFELAKNPPNLSRGPLRLDNIGDLEDSVAAHVLMRVARELPDLPIETFATYLAPLTQRQRHIVLNALGLPIEGAPPFDEFTRPGTQPTKD